MGIVKEFFGLNYPEAITTLTLLQTTTYAISKG